MRKILFMMCLFLLAKIAVCASTPFIIRAHFYKIRYEGQTIYADKSQHKMLNCIIYIDDNNQPHVVFTHQSSDLYLYYQDKNPPLDFIMNNLKFVRTNNSEIWYGSTTKATPYLGGTYTNYPINFRVELFGRNLITIEFNGMTFYCDNITDNNTYLLTRFISQTSTIPPSHKTQRTASPILKPTPKKPTKPALTK